MQELKGSSVKVAIICPSLGKSCGIARYSHYVATSLKKLGIGTALLRSSSDLFTVREDAAPFDFILVQHEYGLFDNLSPLGTGEATSTLVGNIERYQVAYPGTRSAIIMHTIVLTDHVLNIMNQCLFGSAIPVFNLNGRGCYELAIPHLEHGVFVHEPEGEPKARPPRSTPSQRRDRPTVGSFGLLSPNKKPTLIIDICERAQANFIGNFATTSRTAARELNDYAERLKVPATVFTDFCEESDLLDRLAPMDFGIVTQDPITHWATSGSIRFLFNFGVPVLVPYGPQFEDCGEGVIFAHQDEMHFRIDELFASTEAYERASERARSFAEKYEMSKVYAQFLALLADTPPSHLTAYRMRNFRDQRRSLTLIDMMLLGKVDEGIDSADAEQEIIAACASSDAEAADEALQAVIDKQFAETPLKFSVACEGLITPYLEATDRLTLLTSCATLPSNLFQVERFLSHDDTLPPVVRREALRDIQGIQREYHEVVSNRIFSASVTGKLVKQLFPETYGSVGRDAVQQLRRVMQDYIDRIGFRGSANSAPIRIPVLLIMPAAKILSYLARVGGLAAKDLLDLVGTCGLPTDIFDDRLVWVESAAKFIQAQTTAQLSVSTGSPLEFHTRYRAYKAEFAMMSNEQFVYSALALFFKSQPSRGRLQEICNAIDGKTRTEALIHISQQPEATLFQSAVVDIDTPASHEDLPKPILMKKIIDEFFLSESGTFDNAVGDQNFFQIARFWLFDCLRSALANDLFKEKTGFAVKPAAKLFPPKPEPTWLPEEQAPAFIQALSGPLAATARKVLFGARVDEAALDELAPGLAAARNLVDLSLLVGDSLTLTINVQPEPWAKLAAQIPARARTTNLSFKDKDANAKSMPIFDPSWVGEAVSAGLPDRVWANVWNSISRFTAAKIVAPSEFRRVSPWVIAIDQVTEEDEFDFVIVHKGQIDTMQAWLKQEIAKKWQPYFANEVFIVFSKPEVSPLFFDEIHVRVAKDLLPPKRKGLGKLLAR
ncbi:glycosyltransferase family protein [Oleomonas cavernae]|uniref:hypothetical protein n=1 Tax=Oleomonas cavernae TaxID=2320859 RepID=UPI0011C39BE4|nr:hypothetical protein [Oleomonas cavernae]